MGSGSNSVQIDVYAKGALMLVHAGRRTVAVLDLRSIAWFRLRLIQSLKRNRMPDLGEGNCPRGVIRSATK